MDLQGPVYVAGHRGLVGSALWRRLEAAGYTHLIGATSAELDLRDRRATFDFLREHRPAVVIDAAARVGGILANRDHPTEFLSDNLRIQVNLMDAALEVRTPRLLFLGSSCIYPKYAEQPIRESSLLTGELEPTNDAYAIAKIAGIMQVQAVRRQYGLRWISAMPTNLYGPNDNFDPTSLARAARADPAVPRGQGCPARTRSCCGGRGTPRREFLHVDDLADACLHLLEHYDAPGADQRRGRRGRDDPRAGRAGRPRRSATPGPSSNDLSQAGRHPAQAARREQTAGARAGSPPSTSNDGVAAHLRLVPGARGDEGR